jgi:ClpP class serine protease
MSPKRKIKKPPILFSRTQQLVAKLQKKVGCTFLTYWNSPTGSVCQNDALAFYELLQSLGRQKRIALFVKSDGGSGTASLRIVNLLRQHADRIAVLAPLNCVSAATMIALGADEIQMGPLACLSAVDTSITHDLSPIDKDNERVSVSQNELSRILNLWRKEARANGTNPYQAIFQYVHPLVVGSVDRASSLSIRLCTEILSYHMKDRKKAQRVSTILNSDYPSHTYPITLREAQRVGLNAKALDPETNDLLLELNEVYSEMGQKAYTDFDERNYHDNEIPNILETPNIQVLYQIDKDWHYRLEERRWIPMNDKSSWRKIERRAGRMIQTVFHVR